ncbi:ribonuclease domain-containing protein [Xenophilus azovorans]|uniref:ribonuclease domain-containing protein n=1 Tax=Xenophilus azovorans TaxID=151755 RepID=UPI00056F94A0|nr:ribonuclease domain-containing protein [Xenophilus azovorans]
MAATAPRSFSVSKLALTGVFVATVWAGMAGGLDASARETAGGGVVAAAESRARSITLAELPEQGRQTYRTILAGGPFRHDKDGTVFGNRERLLPRERRGHYREYTVPTPGVRHRGARRIVCGGRPAQPEACWYTADHYASFRKIVP